MLAPDGTPRVQIEQAMAAFGVELGLERIREHQLDMLTQVAFSLLDEAPPVPAP